MKFLNSLKKVFSTVIMRYQDTLIPNFILSATCDKYLILFETNKLTVPQISDIRGNFLPLMAEGPNSDMKCQQLSNASKRSALVRLILGHSISNTGGAVSQEVIKISLS